MGAHGSQIKPDDRWKLVLYIRKLQEEFQKKLKVMEKQEISNISGDSGWRQEEFPLKILIIDTQKIQSNEGANNRFQKFQD